MAGFMYVTGDPDRPPVRVGFPHFWLHGAGAAATGAMIALAHRARTGLGQHVDVSCQEAVARALANALPTWTVSGTVISRQGSYRQMGVGAFMRITWPCKDGFVNFQFSGGAGAGPSVNRLVQWMAEEGLGDAYLESLDFAKLGYGMITQEMLERLVPPIERFLMQPHQAGALRRRGRPANSVVPRGDARRHSREPSAAGAAVLPGRRPPRPRGSRDVSGPVRRRERHAPPAAPPRAEAWRAQHGDLRR